MSSLSSGLEDPATGFVEDDFAFEQLPPAPPVPRRVDPTAARDEAEQILAAARGEADSIRNLARAEGHAEGYAAGRADAAAQAAPAVQALAEALVQAQAERDAVADEMDAACVELALEIAAKTVTAAVAVQPERVVDVVRGALRCLVERERVTILVHPDDLEIVRESVDSLVRQLGGMDHIEVQEERRVQRGGAMVRSTTGEIDARLSTKLDRARELLEHELATGSAGA
jgi:flagellar biosynthesis/type III secretory pathway protein FliH